MGDLLSDLLARLENLAELTDEELVGIDASLDEQTEAITQEATTADAVTNLRSIADAKDAIRSERQARVEAAAQLEAEAMEALSRIRGEVDDGTDEDDTDEDEVVDGEIVADDATDTPEASGEGDGDGEVEATEVEAIAAAGRRQAKGAPLARITSHQPVKYRTPNPNRAAGKMPTLRTAPDLRSFNAGQDITWEEVPEAICEMLELSRGAHAGAPIRRRVATLDWRNQYPDDRTLVAGADVEENTRRIWDLLHPSGGGADSLVATGGLCAPLEVRYDVVDAASAERPLRAGLPSFRADRGGLRWMPTTTLSSVVVDTTSGAIDTITVSDDSGGATKTVQEFTCPTEQTAQVYAISERLQFGNFADRYWPENVRSQMNTARAAHSRRAERGLMEGLRAGSTVINAGILEVGAARTFIALIRAAVRNYRYIHRISEEATMRLVVPTWLVDVLFIDLIWQAPGDGVINSGVIDARAWLTRHLSDMNVSPIWQRDDARTNNANGAGAPAFTTQGTGALAEYPGRAEVILFHEGAWLHLDGGQLDFGVIRDSELNEVNKWQTFFEVFENVAMVGLASWDLTILLCSNGTTGAPSTSVGCGPVGS